MQVGQVTQSDQRDIPVSAFTFEFSPWSHRWEWVWSLVRWLGWNHGTCTTLSYWKSSWYYYLGTWLLMSSLHFVSIYRVAVILIIRKIFLQPKNFRFNVVLKHCYTSLFYPSSNFLTPALFVSNDHNSEDRMNNNPASSSPLQCSFTKEESFSNSKAQCLELHLQCNFLLHCP